LVLYQPFAFADVVGAPVRAGGVVSPAGAVDVAVAVLPALSVAVPVTVTPGPTVFEFVAEPSARHVAIPDACPPPEFESEHVNVTVVVPSAFWVCAAVIVGFALSTRTVTEPPDPVLPRRSVFAGAVSVTIPFDDTLSVWKGLEPTQPEPPSPALHWTVTSLLFQPFAFAAGATDAVTTGPVLSRV
jgi:hypothetical protein